MKCAQILNKLAPNKQFPVTMLKRENPPSISKNTNPIEMKI